MIVLLLKLCLPFLVGIAIWGLIRRYLRSKYPAPRALGRVLPKLCVVDADEILVFKQLSEQEWETKPHMRPILRKNRLLISGNYFAQMENNTFRFQQVIRFEALKIAPAKSSLEYDPREVLIMGLVDELPRLRSELFHARLNLVRDVLLGRAINDEPLQTLLGKYKALEHEMIELASMAADTTCRDMLIERLGLSKWRIIPGGGSPKPA